MGLFEKLFQEKKQKGELEEIFATDIKIVGTYSVKDNDDVHFIELEIGLPPSQIDMNLFTQKDERLPKSSWQAAYDEHFFDETGTSVIGEMFDNQKLSGTSTRLGFFLHYIDFTKPLLWQGGEIQLPSPSPMPDRLIGIVTYEPVD